MQCRYVDIVDNAHRDDGAAVCCPHCLAGDGAGLHGEAAHLLALHVQHEQPGHNRGGVDCRTLFLSLHGTVDFILGAQPALVRGVRPEARAGVGQLLGEVEQPAAVRAEAEREEGGVQHQPAVDTRGLAGESGI